MKLSFTTLDVFTSTRYAGNPLAIISLPCSTKPLLTQTQKQQIAKEFNLSEIVFLHLPQYFSPTAQKPFEPTIDIFTTEAEIPFAGHPTIGTAWYLLNVLGGGQKVEAVVTKAGRIAIGRVEKTGEVRAEIPTNYHLHSQTFTCPLTGEVEHPVVSIVKGMSFILAEVRDLVTLAKVGEKDCNNLNPGGGYDPSLLDEKWRTGLVGTLYYCHMSPIYRNDSEKELGRERYRTRMMEGTIEDAGTGSASCALAFYLAGKQDGNANFSFEQGVEMGRRNLIGVSVEKQNNVIEKMVLSGEAVVVMEGSLEVPDASI